MKPRWRLIDSGPGDAFHNMALDEAMAAEVREKNSPPTLRFYGWTSPSLSIGCFQKTDSIDLDYASSAGITVVRRPTGGRGILHGDELTYSFSSPNDGEFSGGLFEAYQALSAVFSEAFLRLGLSIETHRRKHSPGRSPLCFQSASFGEITVGGKKIIGSAQRRWRNGFLQQGSIPMKIDWEKNKEIFGHDGSGSMAGLVDLVPSLTIDALKKEIKRSFEEAFGAEFIISVPTSREEGLAATLLREKYLREEWNLRL